MDPQEIITGLQQLADRFDDSVSALGTEQQIRDLQASFLGKKGEVTMLQKLLGKLPGESRKVVGQAFNLAKQRITSAASHP